MNKKSLLLIITSSLMLSGCGILPPLPTSSTSNPTSTTSITTDTSQTIVTSESSLQPTSEISTISSGKDLEHLEIELTAINDFHGYIEEDDNGRVGLARLTSYLKQRKSAGSLLIDSGDDFQGTFISSYTQGKIISETFKNIGFDAYTIGNHEFDWGIDSIQSHEVTRGKKFLGANIYNYPKGNSWTKSPLGDLYNIVTLNAHTDAEIKVGIIGVIGQDQITSIDSLKVKDYIFLDPTPIIKNLSIELRAAGCDVIVADYHSNDVDTSITEKINGKRYVDAIFTAHTHEMYSYIVNGVPIVQGGAYGEASSEISLNFNKLTHEVTCNRYEPVYLDSLSLVEDSEVKAKISNIKKEVDPIGNQIIGTAPGYISKYDMSRFYAKIAAEKAAELNLNVDYVLFNYSREPLLKGNFTYSDLYATHPFMNELYILSCTEQNISDEISYDQIGYNVCGQTPGLNNNRKDVLVFSYNGFHQAVNSRYEKYYNYFSSGFDSDALHDPIKIEGVNVFDLALDWLKINTLSKSDYSGERFI